MPRSRKAGSSDKRSQAKTPGYCYCGKLAFDSKREAKTYAKQRPYLGIVNIYECDNYGMRPAPPYHLTSIKREDYEGR